ncbi:hypothetical protein GCM10027404_22320 [Arthrobacter tumbae]|uniref:hypothetical protein n=1 Tax=Arthrobacter tumbae TaxID=163874 RepID=UPI00195CED97|nr:hypothetical protein [Arthrobacter tumbae]MBM7781259.1 hypothetical protein [Arthrobacter tumbae]
MKLTGTVRSCSETATNRITASDATYDEAREALEAKICDNEHIWSPDDRFIFQLAQPA